MTSTVDAAHAASELNDAATTRTLDIGAGLREIFSGVATEPVPPSFDELLRRLEQEGP